MSYEVTVLSILGMFFFIALGAIIYDYFGKKPRKRRKNNPNTMTAYALTDH